MVVLRLFMGREGGGGPLFINQRWTLYVIFSDYIVHIVEIETRQLHIYDILAEHGGFMPNIDLLRMQMITKQWMEWGTLISVRKLMKIDENC